MNDFTCDKFSAFTYFVSSLRNNSKFKHKLKEKNNAINRVLCNIMVLEVPNRKNLSYTVTCKSKHEICGCGLEVGE